MHITLEVVDADAVPAGAPVPPPSPMTAVMANQYAEQHETIKVRQHMLSAALCLLQCASASIVPS
eukprot:930021-Amphidinium_carterae.1